MVFWFPGTSTFGHRLQVALMDRVSGCHCPAMVYRPAAVEKGGRRIGAYRPPEPKNELSHAPARVAVCGGAVVLGQPFAEKCPQPPTSAPRPPPHSIPTT